MCDAHEVTTFDREFIRTFAVRLVLCGLYKSCFFYFIDTFSILIRLKYVRNDVC